MAEAAIPTTPVLADTGDDPLLLEFIRVRRALREMEQREALMREVLTARYDRAGRYREATREGVLRITVRRGQQFVLQEAVEAIASEGLLDEVLVPDRSRITRLLRDAPGIRARVPSARDVLLHSFRIDDDGRDVVGDR